MGTGRRAKTSLLKFEKRGQHPGFIGEILFERYVLRCKLERNSFCSKWLAFDSKLDRFVRLSVFREGKQYIMEGLERVRLLQFIHKSRLSKVWNEKVNFFSQNLYSLQSLQGAENFCTGYYNCFVHEGTLGRHFCLVQEYNQFTLKDVLGERLKLPGLKEQLLTLSTQIVVALNFLHFECDVIHGDLGPRNIRVKLPEPLSRIFVARKLMETNLEAVLRSNWEGWEEETERARVPSFEDFKRASFEIRNGVGSGGKEEGRKGSRAREYRRDSTVGLDDMELEIRKNRSQSEELKGQTRRKDKEGTKKSKCDFWLHEIGRRPEDRYHTLVHFQNFRVNLRFLHNFEANLEKRLKLVKEILFPQKITNLVTQKIKIRLDGLGTSAFSDERRRRTATSRDFKAPERLFMKKMTSKADVWSLGCVLYKMINNRDLFHTKKDPYFQLNRDQEPGTGPSPVKVPFMEEIVKAQAPVPQSQKEEFKFVGDQIDSLIGDEDVRQAVMIHCRIQSLPSFMWQSRPLKDFLQFRVKRFIRNEQMEADILDSYCHRKFEKTSRACRDTHGEFFKIEDLRRASLKKLLFERNTLESFLKNTEDLNRVFYKDFARVGRKYRQRGRSRRSSRKFRQFLERNMLSKVLIAALQPDPSKRLSSKELFLVLFKFLFLQRIMERKHLQFYKRNVSESGMSYDQFLARLKGYLGLPFQSLPRKRTEQVYPEDAEKMLQRLVSRDYLYRKQGLLAEISTDIPSPPGNGKEGFAFEELKAIRTKPMFITDETIWERKEKLLQKQFQGRKDVVDMGLFDLERFYKHVHYPVK